jgi:hypothetical protein
MMENNFVHTDPSGNINPDKEKSTERIDGAVATIIALDRAIRNGGGAAGSVNDDRGLLLILCNHFVPSLSYCILRVLGL